MFDSIFGKEDFQKAVKEILKSQIKRKSDLEVLTHYQDFVYSMSKILTDDIQRHQCISSYQYAIASYDEDALETIYDFEIYCTALEYNGEKPSINDFFKSKYYKKK